MASASEGMAQAGKLRTSLWLAITGTNYIGMPALLVYLAAVVGVGYDYFWEDFHRDPAFMIVNFVVLVACSASFVIAHYFLVIRHAGPVFAFLSRSTTSAGNTREEAAAALAASETMPYLVFFWSAAFYGIGTVAAVVSINFAYAYSFRQWAALAFGIGSTGILISVFQFYTTRKVLTRFQETLLTDFPALLLDNLDADRRGFMEVGLRRKFQGAVLLLALVSVVLTSVAAFNGANRGFQLLLGDWYRIRTAENVARVDNLIEQGVIGTAEGEGYFDAIRIKDLDGKGNGREQIILLDKEGKNLLKAEPPAALLRAAEILQKGAPFSVEWGRPGIHTLGKDMYTAVVRDDSFAGSEFAIIHQPSKLADLFVCVPSHRWSSAVSKLYLIVYGSLLVLLIVALVFGYYSAGEILDSLLPLMASIRAMAKGDLSKNVTVTGRDEIGVLARALAQALFGLRRLIARVREATQALDDASEQIAKKSATVSDGSQTQAKAVSETTLIAEEMQGNVRGLTDSIQTLATSAEESSSSIIEVQATIEEVAKSVESLSSAVMQTNASILEMNSSIKEVAQNVKALSKQSGDASEALSGMEKMIAQVNDGARRTAKISEEVSRDAQKGSAAVNLTIDGIDKIRDTSQSVSEVIDRLGRRAQEIGNVLTVIEDVTEETNLLALNAAIIAAQAGEHGRGFAVVADEIKDLAERTAASTKEIVEMISSVQEDADQAVKRVRSGSDTINQGVALSREAGEALKEIEQSVGRALEQSRDIAKAATVQAEKSKTVMAFMEKLNTMAAGVARATDEQTRSGDQITLAAAKMEEIAKLVKRATQEQLQGSRQITQAIEHIAEITHYINSSQSDQMKSTELVRTAVHRIQAAAETNQNEASEMTKSMQRLHQLSEGLNDLLSKFVI